MKNTHSESLNPLSVYETVNSLVGLKSNMLYKTKRYAMFTPLVGNRGEANSYEEKRVQALVAKMTGNDGIYYEEMSIVQVNANGIGIDGMNRIEALRRCGMYVIFRVLTAMVFNSTENKDLLSIVSSYNNSNPTWTAKQQFKAALEAKSELAILLSKLRASVAANDKKFNEGDIRPNQMMTIVERNKMKVNSLKRNFGEYFNNDYLAYAKTPEFETEFRFICDVISYFKVGALNPNSVLKQLFYIMWDDSKFDKDVFWKNLVRHGFSVKECKVKLISDKIIELGVVR